MNQNLIVESITKDIRQKASGFLGVGKKTKERKYMLEVVIKDKNITENYR